MQNDWRLSLKVKGHSLKMFISIAVNIQNFQKLQDSKGATMGEHRERSTEMGKIVVEKWSYFRRVYF